MSNSLTKNQKDFLQWVVDYRKNNQIKRINDGSVSHSYFCTEILMNESYTDKQGSIVNTVLRIYYKKIWWLDNKVKHGELITVFSSNDNNKKWILKFDKKSWKGDALMDNEIYCIAGVRCEWNDYGSMTYSIYSRPYMDINERIIRFSTNGEINLYNDVHN